MCRSCARACGSMACYAWRPCWPRCCCRRCCCRCILLAKGLSSGAIVSLPQLELLQQSNEQMCMRCSSCSSIIKALRNTQGNFHFSQATEAGLHLSGCMSVPPQSALRDFLQPGDAITSINGCAVHSADAFRACIYAQVVHAHLLDVHGDFEFLRRTSAVDNSC